MLSMRVIICVAAVIVILTSAAPAQTDFWHPTSGPYAGRMLSLAENPVNHDLYAGCSQGVFRSTNAGDTWIHTGLQAATVFALAVNVNGYCFAGTQSGVARSTDDGQNWQLQGLGSPVIRSLAIDGSSGRIYAGGLGGMIQRSTDNGDSWTQIHAREYFDTDVRAMIVNAQGHVLAGTYGNAVYRSTDHGMTWERNLNHGMTTFGVLSLAVGTLTSRVFAGTNGKMFISDDGGWTWSESSTGINTTVHALAVSPGGAILAATEEGVYKSIDNGGNWIPGNSGFEDRDMRAILVNGSNGNVLAGSAKDGVYRSTTINLSWKQVGVPAPAVFAMAAGGNHLLYAATNDTLFVYTMRGALWRRSGSGLPGNFVYAVAEGPSAGEVMAGTPNGVFYSDNSGTSWTHLSAGMDNAAVVDLGQNPIGAWYAGTSRGVFRRSALHNSWLQVNNNLPDTTLRSMVIDPGGGQLYVATAREGVQRSSDQGASWVPANNGWSSPTVSDLAMDNVHQLLLAGTHGNGLFRRTVILGGGNWEECNTGIPNTMGIHVLGLFAAPNGDLYAGISGEGVFRSKDRGDSWRNVSSGLTSADVYSFTADANGYLYAGTLYGGVFRSTAAVTGIEDISAEAPEYFMLEQNYPNPFSETTVLHFRSGATEHTVLTIHDALGRRVRTLVDGKQYPGVRSVRWDGRDALGHALPAGLYFCRLAIGSRTSLRAMIKIH